MNHNYQKVVESLAEVNINESYIQKALEEYGFNKFPESGLEDAGLIKLVKTATDIYHSEAQLIQRKTKQGHLPISKIKPKKESKLETSVGSIVKEDLKKAGEGIVEWGGKISKGIAYFTFGPLILPTMERILNGNKEEKKDYVIAACFGTAIEFCGYLFLLAYCNNKENYKVLVELLSTQTVTNLASGIYEYVRHVKKRAENKCYKEKNHCDICSNTKCLHNSA